MDQITHLVVRLENARDEGDMAKAEELQWQIDMLNKEDREPVSSPVMATAYGTDTLADVPRWDDDEDEYALSLYDREHEDML